MGYPDFWSNVPAGGYVVRFFISSYVRLHQTSVQEFFEVVVSDYVKILGKDSSKFLQNVEHATSKVFGRFVRDCQQVPVHSSLVKSTEMT